MTVYQLEIEGDWVYLYSGRAVRMMSHKEDQDPFTNIECFRLKDIRGIRINDDEYTVTLMVKGYTHSIYAEFGYRNPARINAHGHFVCQLADALGLSREKIFDLHRRTKEHVECRSRLEDLDEIITTLNANLPDDKELEDADVGTWEMERRRAEKYEKEKEKEKEKLEQNKHEEGKQ